METVVKMDPYETATDAKVEEGWDRKWAARKARGAEVMKEAREKKLNLVFLHPDLGIGGAERLVIDAAVGLQERGHKVTIFTSHRDKNHCFDEARDGTLDVRVRGDSLIPSSIFGRFKIACAIGRSFHLVAQTCVFSTEIKELKPDIFFVDQLSATVPMLQKLMHELPTWISTIPSASMTTRHAFAYPFMIDTKVLFYCHFPDKLLVQDRSSWLTRFYRSYFDNLESWSTGASDNIVVNSEFTKSVFTKAFPKLIAEGWNPGVVYPCVDVKGFLEGEKNDIEEKDRAARTINEEAVTMTTTTNEPEEKKSDVYQLCTDRRKIILSLNRFERKKTIEHAITAFSQLLPSEQKTGILVIAGGYDTRVSENVQYHIELCNLCQFHDLPFTTARTATEITRAFASPPNLSPSSRDSEILPTPITTPPVSVIFLLSISSALKSDLLAAATILLYTPSNEHFGIVPLEAMLRRVPVLADTSGGPLETVLDGETGWLRDTAAVTAAVGETVGGGAQWSEVLRYVLDETNDDTLKEMGKKGHDRVVTLFSKEKMAEQLEDVMYTMQFKHYRAPPEGTPPLLIVLLVAIIGVVYYHYF